MKSENRNIPAIQKEYMKMEVQKEPYEVPELTVHGDIDEITQWNNPGTADGDLGASGGIQ
jgi:hypothetical protein